MGHDVPGGLAGLNFAFTFWAILPMGSVPSPLYLHLCVYPNQKRGSRISSEFCTARPPRAAERPGIRIEGNKIEGIQEEVTSNKVD